MQKTRAAYPTPPVPDIATRLWDSKLKAIDRKLLSRPTNLLLRLNGTRNNPVALMNDCSDSDGLHSIFIDPFSAGQRLGPSAAGHYPSARWLSAGHVLPLAN